MPESALDKDFLIVALSGRALAASASKAGYRVIVLDLFNDLDTRACAAESMKATGTLGTGFDADDLVALSRRLAPPPAGLVYGSGLEDRPRLLARLSAGRRLFGNRADTLARIKDPRRFFPVLKRLAIPHPETRLDAPPDRRGWLVKRTGAAGGAHIRRADEGPGTADGYYQRRIRGRAVSALFVADGRSARVLGFTEQWSSAGRGEAPFRFGGAALPARLPAALADEITGAVERLVAATGLVGVNSADMMVEGGGFHLIEVNPRPGATVDIFDRALGISLFDLHVRACAGDLPGTGGRPGGAFASAIVYADRDLVVPAWPSWPRWTADLPEPGTPIGAGEPVCTVLATGTDVEAAKDAALRRVDDILAALEPGPYSHHEGAAPVLDRRPGGEFRA